MMKTASTAVILFAMCCASVFSNDALQNLPPVKGDMIRVFLIRHAETHHNAKPGMDPNDPAYNQITPKGEKQAAAIGALLKGQPIVAAYHSETERTKKTLELAGILDDLNLKPKADSAFNRIAMGLKPDGSPAGFDWRIEQWAKGDDPKTKDGESMRDSCQRFFERMMLEENALGKAVVVVSHGDILAGVVGSAECVQPWERWVKSNVPTGSLSIVDVGNSAPALLIAKDVPYELPE